MRDLNAEAIGIEEEDGPVARIVATRLWREMDGYLVLQAALVGLVDLFGTLDEEGEVLDPNVVVVMLAAVGAAETEHLASGVEIDNLLGPTIGRGALGLAQAQWPEDLEVEGE